METNNIFCPLFLDNYKFQPEKSVSHKLLKSRLPDTKNKLLNGQYLIKMFEKMVQDESEKHNHEKQSQNTFNFANFEGYKGSKKALHTYFRRKQLPIAHSKKHLKKNKNSEIASLHLNPPRIYRADKFQKFYSQIFDNNFKQQRPQSTKTHQKSINIPSRPLNKSPKLKKTLILTQKPKYQKLTCMQGRSFHFTHQN